MMDEMNEPDWRDQQHYYRTNSPCQVCGSLWKTGMEPRFLYVVCEKDATMTPVEISNYRRT